MIDKAPRSSWQNIVDRAIEIVHIISDHNVLNDDVRPDNFMIVPNNGTYEVFMIVFGLCRVRRPGESDAEWGLEKWEANEERSLGSVIQKMLSKVRFELRYEFSERHIEWAEGEDE
ncbi:hypothetical protein FVEN_g2029 [Fusarium venenatum]|uniref:Protein kinase domain-containing protein n=1 Tax=Fusarium venenatum TaxID=56646 RepID=A0A2L2SRU8_9HYPO|nr:uncharacterized protein FVRRES_12442 [Fusarium venenatum]KAG8360244.1 hypothetical protein FVEN_g2029 [Fusarium venenatum]CEI39751.1 unnamed protein product [Fusarium venenatum]